MRVAVDGLILSQSNKNSATFLWSGSCIICVSEYLQQVPLAKNKSQDAFCAK